MNRQNCTAPETQTRTPSSDHLGDEEPGKMKATHCSPYQDAKGRLQPAGGAQVTIESSRSPACPSSGVCEFG